MRGGGPFNQIERSGLPPDNSGEEIIPRIQEKEREKIFKLIQEFDWDNVWIHRSPYDTTKWEGFREDHLLDYLKERLYG
jgi:hypothetical protein